MVIGIQKILDSNIKEIDIKNEFNFVFLSIYGLSSAYLNSTKFCLKFHDAFNWLEEWKTHLHVTEEITFQVNDVKSFSRQFVEVWIPFIPFNKIKEKIPSLLRK